MVSQGITDGSDLIVALITGTLPFLFFSQGVENGSGRRSILRGRERSVFKYCFENNHWGLLSDGAERVWAFPSPVMPSWAETGNLTRTAAWTSGPGPANPNKLPTVPSGQVRPTQTPPPSLRPHCSLRPGPANPNTTPLPPPPLFPPATASHRLHAACFPPTCYRLVGLVAKKSASRVEDPGFESRLRRDFSGGRVIPVTLKNGTSVATLPGVWRYRDSAGTGGPGVSIL